MFSSMTCFHMGRELNKLKLARFQSSWPICTRACIVSLICTIGATRTIRSQTSPELSITSAIQKNETFVIKCSRTWPSGQFFLFSLSLDLNSKMARDEAAAKKRELSQQVNFDFFSFQKYHVRSILCTFWAREQLPLFSHYCL